MQDILIQALAKLTDPESGQPLSVDNRLVGADLRKGVATIILKPAGSQSQTDPLKSQIVQAITDLKEVDRCQVIIEANRKPGPSTSKPTQIQSVKPPAQWVIAVGSGKGGVGKSTLTANLAAACVRQGLKTGVIDADIYGPSMPRIFGVSQVPGLQKSDQGIEPLDAQGVKLVSMGFLVGERDPVIWRAPMVTGAVRQFLTEVHWGELDVLIIDMPPGTGDIQLAIAQTLPLSGAVVVSTPQTLALDDAKKAIALFERTAIPVLGLVENMSFFLCSHCGETSEIFGRGGVRSEAELTGVPFLGEIPLHPQLREASDNGQLIALGEGPVANAFVSLAEEMLYQVQHVQKSEPDIIFED